MVDISPVPTLGSGLAPLRTQLAAQTTKVAPVGGSDNSAGAEARMDMASNPGTSALSARARSEPAEAANDVILDENTPTGPPPSFQAKVLDLERDLQRAIERLEAERSRVEADAAMKIERAEARADQAEAKAETSAPPAPEPGEAPDATEATRNPDDIPSDPPDQTKTVEAGEATSAEAPPQDSTPMDDTNTATIRSDPA